MTDVVCLDAGVWIKALAAEELSPQAADVLADSIGNGTTLYDAAYLACTEVVEGTSRTFWTADEALLAALGSARPAYVRHLREMPRPVTGDR